jgi:hypothetical protein
VSGKKPTDERPILKHFEDRIADIKHCKDVWTEAEVNQRFAAGGKHQWPEEVWESRKAAGKPTFTIDDVSLATRALSGREMTARFEPTMLPESEEDGTWAGIVRSAFKRIRRRASAEDIESDAFRSLLIDNVSCIEWKHRFDGREVSGYTSVCHPRIWEMVWDPGASEICMRDRLWDARGYFVGVDEYLAMFPGERNKIQERLNTDTHGQYSKSEQVKYRHPWEGRAKGKYLRRKEDLIFLSDYLWKERQPAYIAEVLPGYAGHPIGPELYAQALQAIGADPGMPIGPEQLPQLQQALQQAAQQGAQVDPLVIEELRPRMVKLPLDKFEQVMEQYGQQFGEDIAYLGPQDGAWMWAVRHAVIVGDEVVREETLPYRDFPRIFLTGIPCRQMEETTYGSVVSSMKSPQEFKNYVMTLAASHLQRSVKSGIIYQPGTFEDEADVESQLSKPFFAIRTRPGVKPSDGNFEIIDGSGFPAGLDRFLDLADQATWRPIGMSPASLGQLMDPRRVSGTVYSSMQEQANTINSWEFSTFRHYKKKSGEILADMIDAHYERDDLADIVGPKRAKEIPPKSQWSIMLSRDVVVEEVPVSKSEKERGWDLMSRQGTLEKMIQAGNAPAWLMPKMMPDEWISEEDRREWINWLELKDQHLQWQQQQEQAAQQGQEGGAPPEEGA